MVNGAMQPRDAPQPPNPNPTPPPAVLFMVAQGITSTGGADWIITKLLGTPRDTMLAQVRRGRRGRPVQALG